MTLNPYHRLPIREKRELANAVQREPPIRCAACDCQLAPSDWLRHIQSCTGERPPPSPRARWVGDTEARHYTTPSQLVEWHARGLLRRNPEGRWLLRDLVLLVGYARLLERL